MYVKYNVAMTLAKLTNMCSNLNLDQGGVWKSKFDQADHPQKVGLIIAKFDQADH